MYVRQAGLSITHIEFMPASGPCSTDEALVGVKGSNSHHSYINLILASNGISALNILYNLQSQLSNI